MKRRTPIDTDLETSTFVVATLMNGTIEEVITNKPNVRFLLVDHDSFCCPKKLVKLKRNTYVDINEIGTKVNIKFIFKVLKLLVEKNLKSVLYDVQTITKNLKSRIKRLKSVKI